MAGAGGEARVGEGTIRMSAKRIRVGSLAMEEELRQDACIANRGKDRGQSLPARRDHWVPVEERIRVRVRVRVRDQGSWIGIRIKVRVRVRVRIRVRVRC
jgi:hypothetical protein